MEEERGITSRRRLDVTAMPGRETAAGRALFALFRGYDLARQRGNAFSRLNALRQQQAESSSRPTLLPPKPTYCPQKQHVRVPRFWPKRASNASEECNNKYLGAWGGGRRKASDILRQLRHDLDHKDLPPYPTKPLLDEKEKTRLAFIFEWSGRLDSEDDALEKDIDKLLALRAKESKTIIGSKVKGSVEEMETMMEAIAKEIEEREEFVREMDKLGQAEKYKNRVRHEIQQRVEEMMKLDQLIRREEE